MLKISNPLNASVAVKSTGFHYKGNTGIQWVNQTFS